MSDTTHDARTAASQRAIRMIAAARQSLGYSAKEVSDQTARLGLPVSRSVIANFESGRRTSMTVDEMVVLARSLGLSLTKLLNSDDCERCGGNPPAGFTCNGCGATAR